MGPPGLRTLVTQQTDQITVLTLQLEASFACNARLNARLSTALDTLDILQGELDAERKKNEKNLWMNIVQELQRERDEMKEVVELLIRKVERSGGNFGRWQHATMHLPSPAGRSTRPVYSSPMPVTLPRMEALLYALTVERAQCRQASEALQNAHEAILTLEAQVARREAELESRDRQCIADVEPVPLKRSIIEALHSSPAEMPIPEAVRSLGVAEEHNHILELEIGELNDRRLGGSQNPRFISVAVQTTPLEFEVPCSPRHPPPTTPTRATHSPKKVVNNVGDLKTGIELLAGAIDGFEREAQTLRETLRLRDPPEARSNHRPVISSALGDSGASPIPNFQYILSVELECHRLTRINKSLERELTELRAAVSPVSVASVPFFRSPAVGPSMLPTTSPSSISTRISGERDMDISLTPPHSSIPLPGNHPNSEIFLGHTDTPIPNNPLMTSGLPRHNAANYTPPGAQGRDLDDRPSSAPPDVKDTHPSALLSPFQLSTSLPPWSKSVELPPQLQEQNSGS